MTDVVWAMAECWCCHRLFGFDPDLVPSVPIKGEREPICRQCVARANPLRIERGLAPIVILPGAYIDNAESWPE